MKIIASDYDGTLNHGGIDDKKRRAIRKWRRAGNLFGLVSGRGGKDLIYIQKKGGFECDFLVASNGAIIIEPDGTVVAQSKCDGSLASTLIEYIFSLGCNWADIHTAFNCTVKNDGSELDDDEYTPENMPDIPYFNQISTILPDEEKAAEVTEKIRQRFCNSLNPLQNGRCIDIVGADINKAKGLYKLLEIYGAQHGDLIAVGDNINDTHMIAEFRSYAMENAVESIKKLADEQTPGIAELIEKELKNN